MRGVLVAVERLLSAAAAGWSAIVCCAREWTDEGGGATQWTDRARESAHWFDAIASTHPQMCTTQQSKKAVADACQQRNWDSTLTCSSALDFMYETN
jgi:hypothetical protein